MQFYTIPHLNGYPEGACLVIGGLALPEDNLLQFSRWNVALGHSFLDETKHLTPNWIRSKCFFYRLPYTDFWHNNPIPAGITLEANSVAFYGNVQLNGWVIKTKCEAFIHKCFAGQFEAYEAASSGFYQSYVWHHYLQGDRFGCGFLIESSRDDEAPSFVGAIGKSHICGSALIGPLAHLIGNDTRLEVGTHLINQGKVTLDNTYRLHIKGRLVQPTPSNTIFFKYPANSPHDIDVHVEGDIMGFGNIIAEGRLPSP